MHLRFRRASPNEKPRARLHDPLALEARPGMSRAEAAASQPRTDTRVPLHAVADLLWSILSVPKVLPDILAPLVPYALVVAAFGAFVVWNGGIVLGQ